MINVLMCVNKSGDILPFTLQQLVNEPSIIKILIADGPHLGPIKPGLFVDKPSVKEVVDTIASKKIYYEYTDDMPNRAWKNNKILKHTTRDCEWIFCIDSDEVYHENDLRQLVDFLNNTEYGRYGMNTIDFYPDFGHIIQIKDAKPRLYRYKKNYCLCNPKNCRDHQFVLGPISMQKLHPLNHFRKGFDIVPEAICKLYHLNAIRTICSKGGRITVVAENKIIWSGGKSKRPSDIYEIDSSTLPWSIRQYIEKYGHTFNPSNTII